MSCCRTLLVLLSLFLSIFFFIYGIFLSVKSKIDQDTPRQSNESLHQIDPHQNESYIQVSAYMPDAKALKYVNTRNSSSTYSFKISSDFLKSYEVNETTSHDCDVSYPPPRGRRCSFNLGPCAEIVKNESMSGVQETRNICVFMKLKNDFNFIPKYYNALNFPLEMPRKLKELIRQTPRRNRIIWLSCDAEYGQSKQKIGDIRYFPQQGFSGYFFPCRRRYGQCVDPIVAILISNSQGQKNIAINVTCRTWAENIWDKLEYTIFIA